jgi:hypothetical protein
MNDISFFEWFFLGMPVEWFVLSFIVIGGMLLWGVVSSMFKRKDR